MKVLALAVMVMYHFPQWSPDGRSIVASSPHDGDTEIYLLSVDGGATKKLTDNTASDDRARWSPDGRRIFFVTDRQGRSETFSMLPDGSDQRSDADTTAVRSKDGRTELVEDNGTIYSIDVATKARRPVTSGPWAEQPTFSPDGKWMAYEQRTSKDPHRVDLSNIILAKADGSEPRIVHAGTDPSWSPDGKRLLFKVMDQTTRELWVTTAKPDGTAVRRLARGVHPHWSPDGKRIAFMQDGPDMETHIWVISQDGSSPKCLTCATH